MTNQIKPFTPTSPFYRKILSNPLRTRSDVASALTDILDALEPFTSPGGARIHLGETGAHFDEVAAELEGFSRPLWGLASLVAGGSTYSGVSRWAKGLASGTDPKEGNEGEFWGDMRDKDQRMVECSAIGYSLAVAGDVIWGGLSEDERRNVGDWLGAMNDKAMPSTNWLWFRIFANLGLYKVSSNRFSLERMKADLDHLDTFYIGDGWSRDGPEGVVQLDYYSSSFAIQVAQLLYSKLAQDIDPERCEEFRKRAKLFAMDFIHYFDPQGRSIPFGRSQAYRFATSAFWSAFAYAISPSTLPPPFTPGIIKGLQLRNLRSWLHDPEILQGVFTSTGILTLGYTYPNMNMLENYNSPGSPYWCCKAFICLALDEKSEFWSCVEEPYPIPSPHSVLPSTKNLTHALHITTSLGGHTYLLSSGQQCSYPVKQSAAKYGKFGYSSAFGYSVPSGAGTLEEQGGDSVLVVSDGSGDSWGGGVFAFDEAIQSVGGGGGEKNKSGGVYGYGGGGGEGWRARRETKDPKFEYSAPSDPPTNCPTSWLRSTWHPYPDVTIETFLIPPHPSTPLWHLRIHRLRTRRRLWIAEGGWAVDGRGANSRSLEPISSSAETGAEVEDLEDEGTFEGGGVVRVTSCVGVSGIIDLPLPSAPGGGSERRGIALRTDANTSLIFPRAVVPTLRSFHDPSTESSSGQLEKWLVTAVFGFPFNPENGGRKGWVEEWKKRPVVPKEILELMGQTE